MKITHLILSIVFLCSHIGFGEEKAKWASSERADSNLNKNFFILENHSSIIKTLVLHAKGSAKRPCLDILEELREYFVKPLKTDLAEKVWYGLTPNCYETPEIENNPFEMELWIEARNEVSLPDLRLYLEKHDGKTLFGTTFKFATAKGVFDRYSFEFGKKDGGFSVIWNLVHRKHWENYTASNNYKLSLPLMLPIGAFLTLVEKEVGEREAEYLGKDVLKRSNYIKATLERSFVLENNEVKFFTHSDTTLDCRGTESGFCKP